MKSHRPVILDLTILLITLISLVGIILLELGSFGLAPTITISLVVFGLIVFKARERLFKNQKLFRLRRSTIYLFLILLLAVFFRIPSSHYTAGDQDQGIYVNTAYHIARTGSVYIDDPIKNLIKERPKLHEYYLKHTYSGLGKRPHIPWAEIYLPGIYFDDSINGKFVPQFYHLHPIWMALSLEAFGPDYMMLPMLMFSLLTIVCAFYLSRELFANKHVALVSAMIFAVNPAISYLATFPLSECLATFFFIAALYYFVRSKQICWWSLGLSAFCFAGLFFTRITGFFFIATLMMFVASRFAFEKNLKKRHNNLVYLTIVEVLYAWSYYHGLFFSSPYSRHTYLTNVGLTGDLFVLSAYLMPALAAINLAIFYGIRFSRRQIRLMRIFTCKHRNFIMGAGALSLFGIYLFLGYRLGFTDHFADHPWLGKKWHIAGREWLSIQRFNIVVLSKLLTPAVMLLFLIGLLSLARRSIFNARHSFIFLHVVFFLVLLTVYKNTTPYIYHYARYLSSELVPLAILLAATGFFKLTALIKDKQLRAAVASILFVIVIIPSAEGSKDHSEKEEMKGFHEALSEIDSQLKDNTLLVIDRNAFPIGLIATPLRVAFNRPIFVYRRTKDMRIGDLRPHLDWFEEQGYNVVILSRQDGWKKFEFLEANKKVIVPWRRLQFSRGALPNWENTKSKPAIRLTVYDYKSAKDYVELEKESLKIGAHYYLWFPDNFNQGIIQEKLVPPQQPMLGRYSSEDIKVAEQHIAWASEYGIDFFTLDYWPRTGDRNKRIDTTFLKAKNIGDIKFCIFYETWDLRFVAHHGATVFTEKAVEIFLKDMESFADKYFDHPSYLKVDGRPVVFLYLTRTFGGPYKEALAEARRIIKEKGFDVYFIADEIFWDVTQARKDKKSFKIKMKAPQIPRIKLFDAITSYNLYTRRYWDKQQGYGVDSTFFDDIKRLYQKYLDAEGMDRPLAPVLLPGYNDRFIRPKNFAIPRQWEPGAPEGSYLDKAFEEIGFPYIDDDLRMLFITTWNEWNEGTAIEPAKPAPATNKDISPSGDKYTQGYNYVGYGTAYLETVRDNVSAIHGQIEPNTRIYVWQNKKLLTTTLSDSNGHFTISRGILEPGTYQVGINKNSAVDVKVVSDLSTKALSTEVAKSSTKN